MPMTTTDWANSLRYGTTPIVKNAMVRRDARTRMGQLDMGDPAVQLAVGISLAGSVAGLYHGYKRNERTGDPLLWSLVWGVLGGAFPLITVPIAFAQGFGQPK